jgi:HK97 family phage portal protein
MRLFSRAILPPDEPVVPNDNDPADVPPATVGPPSAVPGDPHGVTVEETDNPGWSPPRITASAWSGWPAEWSTPLWSGQTTALADIAWECIDKNSNLISTMPPYLVNAAPTLTADWLRNPDPDLYFAWEEFAKQLVWDFQAVGEVFVIATARYATGWPARFHVVPPWSVNAEMDGGKRSYSIGDTDVTADVLHVRYQSSVADARGHGPLEAGNSRIVAAQMLLRYGLKLTAEGGIPPGVLSASETITDPQADAIKAKWVQARLSSIGEPAVLGGGLTWTPTQLNPRDMALIELQQQAEARIASLLGVPPHIVSLPSPAGESMTYANVTNLTDEHWRIGLRPLAARLMAALSEFLLPRGTRIEVNSDAYVQPEPLVRAQTAQILNSIQDRNGNPVLTVEQIQEAERLTNSSPADLASGVLR